MQTQKKQWCDAKIVACLGFWDFSVLSQWKFMELDLWKTHGMNQIRLSHLNEWM